MRFLFAYNLYVKEQKMKELIILMTRVPEKGTTKSRLSTFFSKEQIQHISIQLLKKNYEACLKADGDLVFYVTSRDPNAKLSSYLEIRDTPIWEQEGEDLGERMAAAFKRGFQEGYESIVLIGSDLYDMTVDILNEALMALNEQDVVLTPSIDGGYGLIGMKALHRELFEIEAYGTDTVLEAVLKVADEHQLSYQRIQEVRDIDTPEDIARIITSDEEAQCLAAGEYNANFIFDQDRQILRIALGSQLHLDDQIAYEYKALQALSVSGVTAQPYELQAYSPFFGFGYLTEEFLPGRALEYETDLLKAAELLARVHGVDPKRAPHLRKASYPFRVMQEEFESMFSHYEAWPKKNTATEEKILKLWSRLDKDIIESPVQEPVIINTELNSGNFLINEEGPSYIIDWEKPLLGEREQDLGHFLVPTTTLWKTDNLLSWTDIAPFIACYEAYSGYKVNIDRLISYLQYTCIRGLTWCAMAYVHYNEASKGLRNDETYKVISMFLTEPFIERIEMYFDELEERRRDGT